MLRLRIFRRVHQDLYLEILLRTSVATFLSSRTNFVPPNAGFLDNLEVWDTILRSDVVGLQDLFLPSSSSSTSSKVQPSDTSKPSQLPVESQQLPQRTGPAQGQHPSTTTDETTRIAIETIGIGNSQVTITPPEEAQASRNGNERNAVTTGIQQGLIDQQIQNAVTSETVLAQSSLRNLGCSELFSGTWTSVQVKKDASLRPKTIGSDREWVLEGRAMTKSFCPSAGDISNLVRAMSEMSRLGEASFTIVQTPPSTAAWVITFIRWCLGVEPYIRRLNGQQLVLKQSESHVLVEIDEYGSTTFGVRTFKTFQGIHELLWESQSAVIQPVPWTGMMKIKTYFNTRLQKLRTSYHLPYLSHVLVTFLVLASNLEQIYQQYCAKNRFPLTWQFQSRRRLISLIAMYFDIEDPWSQINRQDRYVKVHISILSNSKSLSLVDVPTSWDFGRGCLEMRGQELRLMNYFHLALFLTFVTYLLLDEHGLTSMPLP